MLRNKINQLIVAFIFIISTLISTAVIPAESYDGGSTSSTANTSFRTCPGDPDVSKILEIARDPYSRGVPGKDNRAPVCDHIQFQCLYSVRVDCVENQLGYSWKCINYGYDFESNAYGEDTRDIDGAAQSVCSISKRKLDGKCSTTKNKCESGTVSNINTTTEANLWSCLGEGGGQNDQCQELIPQVVDGKCGNTRNTCSKGSLSDQTENTKEWAWTCLGLNGGNSASCAETKPFKGECGTKPNTCAAGTSTRQTKYTEKYLWACQGIGSGSLTSCSQNRVAPGVCSKTEANKCTEGYPSDMKTTATANTWTCTGIGGASSASCSKKFPPEVGICSSSHYKCAKGTSINQITTTDVWSWVCPGLFGGAQTLCTESMGVKKGVCSVAKNQCNVGTPTGITEESSAYKWTCIGPNRGGDTACETKKKTEGICGDEKDTCLSGTLVTKPESKKMYYWSCKGLAGGKSETCSEPKFATSSAAVCYKEHYACVEGEVTDKAENVASWTWTCDGGDGGKNVKCSEAKIVDDYSSTSTISLIDSCSLTDTACLLKQCKGNVICEDTVKKCVKGESNCVENFVIVPGAKEPYKTNSCALNDSACLVKQCKGNIVCEDTINKCSNGDVKCVKNLVIDPNTTFAGNNDSCAIDDLECLLKKCNGNLACINALKKCKTGDTNCINEALGLTGTSIDGPVTTKPLVCKSGDIECLVRKCNGSVAGENAIRKCKKTDTKCLNNAMLKCNPGWGPSFKENNGTCSSQIFSCKYGTNYNNIRDTESFRWSCIGKNGGDNSNCLAYKPKDAVCSTKTRNTCDVGKPTKASETSKVWNWVCMGVGTGESANCSMNIVPLDGVCSTKAQTCDVGKVLSFRKNGDWNEWVCSGSYGGKNTDCFKEIKGSCSINRYACESGYVDSKSETKLGYGWKCRGANGDLTVSCFEKKPNIEESQNNTGTTSLENINLSTTTLSNIISSTINLINSKVKLFSMAVDNLLALI